MYDELDNKSKKILIDFYRDDVKNLENILGYKLPWSNFQDKK